MGKRLELEHRIFGALKVIDRAHKNKHGVYTWNCLCECGNKINIPGGSLTSGNTKSCGCNAHNKKHYHNMSKTNIHKIWRGLLARCYTKTATGYKHYGGRGIEVSDEWKNDFMKFWKDMGDMPSKDHSIDRIDNNRNYSKNNCKWSTKEEQANNKRNSRLITYNGETKTATQWSVDLGGNKMLVATRLYKGWSEERAVSTPPRFRN